VIIGWPVGVARNLPIANDRSGNGLCWEWVMRKLVVLAGCILVLAGLEPTATAQDGPRFNLDCDRAQGYSRGARGAAIIVVYQGEVVCERYSPGISADDSWEMASGVKSFVGVMAAAAVQDGLLQLDERVADTLTEWQDDPRKSRITIRQLLSLSSGLAVNNRARRVESYADSIQTRARHEPGERFEYSARPFAVFGEVLRRKLEAAGLDQSPGHYFQRRILAPIGVRLARWGAVDGMPILSENASITPMEWARFGYLVSRDAQIGDAVLADHDAMAAMFEPSAANPIYGMTWWLPNPENTTAATRRSARFLDTVLAGDDFPTLHLAAGAGSQRLYLFPELDLVVVRMTRGVIEDPETRSTDWSDRRFIETLLQPVETEPGDEDGS
jgi:CubicO group peptidase (beta-lactamase class C family)